MRSSLSTPDFALDINRPGVASSLKLGKEGYVK
jgi:hypothetical protein